MFTPIRQINWGGVIKLEMLKLVRIPALAGFLITCLILNTIVVFTTSNKRQIDYINEVTILAGAVYNDDYREKIGSLSAPRDSDLEWLHESLVQAASEVQPLDYETTLDEILDTLEKGDPRFTQANLDVLKLKYRFLEIAAAEPTEKSSVYFGPSTNYIHESTFGLIGRLLAAETCVFFLLIMLLSLGYDWITRTAPITFSTTVGRRLTRSKTVAALGIGTGFFAVLYMLTFGLVFLVNDFSLVWSQTVSAPAHTTFDSTLGHLPFITWFPFTIGQYLWASIGVAYLTCLVVGVSAIPVGLLITNSYMAFSVFAGLGVLQYIFYVACPGWGIWRFLWSLTAFLPMPQILNNSLWFSHGGVRMLLPYFELLSPMICLLLLVPCLVLSSRLFNRKEISC